MLSGERLGDGLPVGAHALNSESSEVRSNDEMSVHASIPQWTDGRSYEAVLRLSEALSLCQKAEDLTKILSEQLREFLAFLTVLHRCVQAELHGRSNGL